MKVTDSDKVGFKVTPLRLGLAVALVAAIAWAAPALSIDPGSRLIKGNLTVNGTTSHVGVTSFGALDAGTLNVSGDAGIGGKLAVNGFTFTPVGRGVLNWDFGALTGTPGQGAPLATIMEESGVAATATGCAFGDAVLRGIDQALPNFGNVNCYVSAADAVKCRASADGITDGGSFNVPDASYTVTCVR